MCSVCPLYKLAEEKHLSTPMAWAKSKKDLRCEREANNKTKGFSATNVRWSKQLNISTTSQRLGEGGTEGVFKDIQSERERKWKTVVTVDRVVRRSEKRVHVEKGQMRGRGGGRVKRRKGSTLLHRLNMYGHDAWPLPFLEATEGGLYPQSIHESEMQITKTRRLFVLIWATVEDADRQREAVCEREKCLRGDNYCSRNCLAISSPHSHLLH